MKIPDSEKFRSEVAQVFSFLIESGFSTELEDYTNTPLYAGVTFRGNNVAISLGLDRREACIDCYIARVKNGRLARNDVPGGYWGPLHGFLIKHRGYRGAFKKSKIEDEQLEWYQRDLKRYAEALKSLAPDMVQDLPTVFNQD